MDNSIAIRLNNITKNYKIYKHSLGRFLDVFRRKPSYTPFTAISNISLEIPRGEVVGIMGKNGSGKSTLMKMIVGVTTPTSGTIEVDGRISAILELTAGFNEEFTGVENIYLKALSLSIPQDEIQRMLPDIIDFADIGEYIDRPVRTYSSGMKARLGFAIAVSTEPDILVVDEALAVGDDVFKFKCMRRMEEFRQQGKTILFVTHSLFLIKSFCTLGLWLNEGKQEMYGEVGVVANRYEDFLKKERKQLKSTGREESIGYKISKKSDIIAIDNFTMHSGSGEASVQFKYGDDIYLDINYTIHETMDKLFCSFTIRDAEGVEVYSSDRQATSHEVVGSTGTHSITLQLIQPNLIDGSYLLSGQLWNNDAAFYVNYANRKEFEIVQDCFTGTGITHIKSLIINH